MLKTYNMHTDENIKGKSFGVNFNAPLKAKSDDSLEKSIELFIHNGAPPNKLLLGISFFSRWYNLRDPKQTTPGSPYFVDFQAKNSSFVQGFNQVNFDFNRQIFS